jgi:hypothetical protein
MVDVLNARGPLRIGARIRLVSMSMQITMAYRGHMFQIRVHSNNSYFTDEALSKTPIARIAELEF